jgi:hypothetical protein
MENFIHCSAAAGQGKSFAVRSVPRFFLGLDSFVSLWLADAGAAPSLCLDAAILKRVAYFRE